MNAIPVISRYAAGRHNFLTERHKAPITSSEQILDFGVDGL